MDKKTREDIINLSLEFKLIISSHLIISHIIKYQYITYIKSHKTILKCVTLWVSKTRWQYTVKTKNHSLTRKLMNSTLESIIDLINMSHLYTSYERYLATHHNYPSEGKAGGLTKPVHTQLPCNKLLSPSFTSFRFEHGLCQLNCLTKYV